MFNLITQIECIGERFFLNIRIKKDITEIISKEIPSFGPFGLDD